MMLEEAQARLKKEAPHNKVALKNLVSYGNGNLMKQYGAYHLS